MLLNLPVGLVFGRLLAQRAGVNDSAAQNRAGLLMAAGGGLTPVGVILANSAINASSNVGNPTSTGETETTPLTSGPTFEHTLGVVEAAANAVRDAAVAFNAPAPSTVAPSGSVTAGSTKAPPK